MEEPLSPEQRDDIHRAVEDYYVNVRYLLHGNPDQRHRARKLLGIPQNATASEVAEHLGTSSSKPGRDPGLGPAQRRLLERIGATLD